MWPARRGYVARSFGPRPKLANGVPAAYLEPRLAVAGGAVAKVAYEQPNRPSWIGDRFRRRAPDGARLWARSGDRLATSAAGHAGQRANRDRHCPRVTAQGGGARGVGLLYVAVGAIWWPGLVVAAVVICTGQRRGRVAADTYGLLVDAATRMHTGQLAISLGRRHTGLLDRRTGWALTCVLQGQTHLIPITSGWPEGPTTTDTPDELHEPKNRRGCGARTASPRRARMGEAPRANK